jgi:hypothetical protein
VAPPAVQLLNLAAAVLHAAQARKCVRMATVLLVVRGVKSSVVHRVVLRSHVPTLKVNTPAVLDMLPVVQRVVRQELVRVPVLAAVQLFAVMRVSYVIGTPNLTVLNILTSI